MNNAVRIDLYIAVRNLRANWKDWDIARNCGNRYVCLWRKSATASARVTSSQLFGHAACGLIDPNSPQSFPYAPWPVSPQKTPQPKESS